MKHNLTIINKSIINKTIINKTIITGDIEKIHNFLFLYYLGVNMTRTFKIRNFEIPMS